MSKGKAHVNYLGREGIVGHSEVPDWDFLYVASSVKDPKWNVGDRVVLPDGRVFRYAKLGGAITSARVDYGLYSAVTSRNKWYETLAQAQSAGDKSIVLPFDEAGDTTNRTARSTTVVQDELRGGYVVIYKNGVANQCVRGIVGNTPSKTATPYEVTIYLDAAIPHALTTSDGAELIESPWSDVRSMFADNATATTCCGMPTVVAASGDYTWVQTKGVCRVSLTEPGVLERSVYCMSNGAMCNRGDIGSGGCMDQIVGHIIIPTVYQSAFINLNISE